MKKLGFLLGISFLTLFISCTTNDIECLRVSDKVVSETRDLKNFNGVAFNNIGNVFITQGPEYAFNITGPENVVELTTTSIENNLLVIGSDACFNGTYDLKIEITAPEYTRISLVGVGDIKSVGPIEATNIAMEMVGIGKIDVNISADTLTTTIAGTGDVVYSGSVIKHDISCAGTYELNAYSLETENTSIQLSGIGDGYVKANQLLDVTITGTGNVYYKGSPDITSTIVGTGSVIDSN